MEYSEGYPLGHALRSGTERGPAAAVTNGFGMHGSETAKHISAETHRVRGEAPGRGSQ